MKLFTKLALSLSLAFMLHAADLQFNVPGTADTAMTAAEQKAIGVNKMSKTKRAALDKWMANYAAPVANRLLESARSIDMPRPSKGGDINDKVGTFLEQVYICGRITGIGEAAARVKPELVAQIDQLAKQGDCENIKQVLGVDKQ